MRDYGAAARTFNYQHAADAALAGSLTALNACVECCDRHVGDDERTALYWEGRDGQALSYSFNHLQAGAARFANVLKAQGVGPGDRVAGLLPRTVELLITVLATWRLGAVYQPLFTAFGPKAIEHRLHSSAARVVVTDPGNRAKLDDVEGCPTIICVNAEPGHGDIDFHSALNAADPQCEPVLLAADAPFLMMFTSGTTGPAKPLQVPLRAIIAFQGYMRDAIDLRPEDNFWNLADPGWAYGLYYAVTGPLALGHATTFFDGPFSVESTCRVIDKYAITNLAGSPTAYRMLIAAGEAFSAPIKGRLRAVSSAGEPLNRFECYFLNTMEQAASLVKRVDEPNYGYLFDTFHSNIEENNVPELIGKTIAQINHVHISENNRGVPGAGHIAFQPVFNALKRSGYDGWMTIEAFGSPLPDLAAATMVTVLPATVHTAGVVLAKTTGLADAPPVAERANVPFGA